MINLLILLILNSFYIFGLHYSMLGGDVPGDEGEILSFVRKWVDYILPIKPKIKGNRILLPRYVERWKKRYKSYRNLKIRKPILDCMICMSSFHGTYIFLLFHQCHLYYLPFYIIALAGLNRIITSLVGDI